MVLGGQVPLRAPCQVSPWLLPPWVTCRHPVSRPAWPQQQQQWATGACLVSLGGPLPGVRVPLAATLQASCLPCLMLELCQCLVHPLLLSPTWPPSCQCLSCTKCLQDLGPCCLWHLGPLSQSRLQRPA